MLIIPVIDLYDGIVVHARQGERDQYQAISSPLSSNPVAASVLTAYLELYPFKTIYIADLNAIQDKEDNSEIIKSLAIQYPDCEFWLDAGIKCIVNNCFDSCNNIKLILGSENKMAQDTLTTLLKNNSNIILSLDFNASGLLQNDYLLQQTDIWPEKLIVMSLDKVGSNIGPDTSTINSVLAINQASEIYAAGGIRNKNDIEQLKKTGITGVLLATAIHNGAINREDIKQLC